MFIRCKNCHGTVWLEPSQSDGARAKAICDYCGQHYEVDGASGRAARNLAASARRLAKEQEIDLPGAYSVLLKIMGIERLREVGRMSGPAGKKTRGAEAEAVASGAAPSGPSARRYDPAFELAVKSGLLTARQAMERGGREIFASSVASRQGLALEVAYAVADNKISLLEALRMRRARPDGPVRVNVERGPLPRIVWLTTALLLVAVFVVIQRGTSSKPTPGEVVTRKIGDTEVKVDDRGRVLEVRGLDPKSVLRTFCVAGDRPFQALAAVPSTFHGPQVRLGLLRDPSAPSAVLAIVIREDRASKGWVAGDGIGVLVADAAPPGIAASFGQTGADTAGSSESPASTGRFEHDRN